MRICLVDDESSQLDLLNSLIQKWASKNGVDVNISFYSSSEEMLFECEGVFPYDIILLDIQMGEMNGLKLGKKIRETDQTVMIVFVSGIADYVYEGYEVQALRYLLKPVKEEKLYELLSYVQSKVKNKKSYLIFSLSGEKKKLCFDNIIYFESLGHYITIHSTKGEFDYKYGIGMLWDNLNGTDFVRTHRSYIVNLKYVEKINKSECELNNQEKIPLSRNSYKLVNKKFIDYYKGQGV